MYFLVRVVLICTAVSFILSESGTASVIFRPGKKAKFVPPGEEEISGTALELYQTGQTAEKEGNLKRAIHAYKDILPRVPSIARRNCRNKCTTILARRIHIGSWSKDIPVTHTSMKQSRRSFA